MTLFEMPKLQCCKCRRKTDATCKECQHVYGTGDFNAQNAHAVNFATPTGSTTKYVYYCGAKESSKMVKNEDVASSAAATSSAAASPYKPPIGSASASASASTSSRSQSASASINIGAKAAQVLARLEIRRKHIEDDIRRIVTAQEALQKATSAKDDASKAESNAKKALEDALDNASDSGEENDDRVYDSESNENY